MPTINLQRPAIALGAILCLITAGCGNDPGSAEAITEPGIQQSAEPNDPTPVDEAAPDDTSTTTPPTTDTEATGDEPGDTTDPTTESDGEASDERAEPVASMDLERSSPGGKPVSIRVDLLELRRNDSSVSMSFEVHNLSAESFFVGTALGEGPTDRNSVAGVSLVDLANDKRYLTLVDANGECVCTASTGEIFSVPKQGALTLQASFPAPPKDVTTVDVDLRGFGVIPSVTIEAS